MRISALILLLTLASTNAFARHVSVEKLRTFCKSCHATGALRFIWSEDDDEVWHYLAENRAPNSNLTWAAAIVDVLSWPSEAPPSLETVRDPENNRDWMPRGRKRLLFADDKVDGETTRRIVIRELEYLLSVPGGAE